MTNMQINPGKKKSKVLKDKVVTQKILALLQETKQKY